jgi:hypothetical protein
MRERAGKRGRVSYPAADGAVGVGHARDPAKIAGMARSYDPHSTSCFNRADCILKPIE